jgi:hypothetical protein
MTKEELAKKLNGHIYREDFDKGLVKEAEKNKLVICYGASDDLFELEGAIQDEGDCYGGADFLVDKEGIVRRPDSEMDDDKAYNKMIEAYSKRYKAAKKISAMWCKEKNPSGWSFKTSIPHAKFKVMEEEGELEVQCIGMVFAISDL